MSEELESAAPLSPPSNGAEDGPGMLARLGVVGSARIVIGACGLAAFVVGTIIAWRSGSATTLLIVSAVLLVLAALGLDWNKIRGTYGGWTVELLRSFESRIEKVAATAVTEEASPAIRDELETIRAEIKALTPPASRRRATTPLPVPANIDALLAEAVATRATHNFRGTDAVQLSLNIASRAERFSCTVKTPTGASFHTFTRRPISAGASMLGMNSYGSTYPDEFDGAEPFVPGRYEVEWRPAPLIDPASPTGVAPALSSLFRALGAATATDSFSIPERASPPPPPPD